MSKRSLASEQHPAKRPFNRYRPLPYADSHVGFVHKRGHVRLRSQWLFLLLTALPYTNCLAEDQSLAPEVTGLLTAQITRQAQYSGSTPTAIKPASQLAYLVLTFGVANATHVEEVGGLVIDSCLTDTGKNLTLLADSASKSRTSISRSGLGRAFSRSKTVMQNIRHDRLVFAMPTDTSFTSISKLSGSFKARSNLYALVDHQLQELHKENLEIPIGTAGTVNLSLLQKGDDDFDDQHTDPKHLQILSTGPAAAIQKIKSIKMKTAAGNSIWSTRRSYKSASGIRHILSSSKGAIPKDAIIQIEIPNKKAVEQTISFSFRDIAMP